MGCVGIWGYWELKFLASWAVWLISCMIPFCAAIARPHHDLTREFRGRNEAFILSGPICNGNLPDRIGPLTFPSIRLTNVCVARLM